ncbi:hypothetical protein JVT61DRAFT_3176 [Boletus reticuloceps]|uniref:Uncharacterized protein n=1 Tax=Boletus reticuloceps TaxID=495285 RepID=A0A8I2YNT9_9AGAM|nr:hypothetical protein JVT61DRAFT_3176 [Boletus reticuloceps]
MVTTPIKPQRLSVGDAPDNSSDNNGKGEWGTPQIATPAIVGGILLLLFAAYFIWQRKPLEKRSYDYRPVRSEWTSRIERMFSQRRKRHRVLHSSTPVTLVDSMRSSGYAFDLNRGSRVTRSDSSDSQTPLTSTCYALDYPPNESSDYPPNRLSDSPPPIPKPPMVRWWWIFGSRPQQIKSEEPGQRWRVDDPDGSSSGHGHTSNGYAGLLRTLYEGQEDGEDEVIRIGENFPSVASTPMIQPVPEQAGVVRGMPMVPEHPQSNGTLTPPPAASALTKLRRHAGRFLSRLHVILPPSYDLSQLSQSRFPSTEATARLAHSGPYMTIPPPVRAAGYSSPRMFHGRDLSSESFLATQPPMVVTSMY